MVARGPRTNGAKPGIEPRWVMPARSAAVYNGFSEIPSGVLQRSVSGDAPFKSLEARALQSSSVFAGKSAILFELQDNLIHAETLPCLSRDLGDGAVTLGAEHVLHLHGLDDCELLARFHRLAFLDGDRNQKARHR